MPIWQAVLLGVIQGVTEFLPISSTAHLILVQEWLGRTQEELENDPVTVVVQLGTLFAVFVYFRHDIARMIWAFVDDLRAGYWIRSITEDSRIAKLIIVGTIPGVIVGILFKKQLKLHFYNATSIAVVSIVFALLMAAAEIWARQRKDPPRETDRINVWDAIFIGIFQAMALMPGGSRSGTTITAGLFLGLGRPAAARFSFLLSIPIMVGAGIKELYDWYKHLKANPDAMAEVGPQAFSMMIATLVAAVVGYAAIAWLLGFLRNHSLMSFVWYRLFLAAVILVILGISRSGP